MKSHFLLAPLCGVMRPTATPDVQGGVRMGQHKSVPGQSSGSLQALGWAGAGQGHPGCGCGSGCCWLPFATLALSNNALVVKPGQAQALNNRSGWKPDSLECQESARTVPGWRKLHHASEMNHRVFSFKFL